MTWGSDGLVNIIDFFFRGGGDSADHFLQLYRLYAPARSSRYQRIRDEALLL